MPPPTGLDPDRPIGEALREVALSILSESRTAIETADKDRSVAIHEFRKQMKRWRSLLRLLASFLGEECQQLRQEARDLARSFATARDVQSALTVLSELAPPAADTSAPLSSRSLARIRCRLEDLRSKSEQVTLDRQKLQMLFDYITKSSCKVAHWELDKIRFRDLSDRLAHTYRRARRAIPADWRAASSEELHELRRRVIEHRYQMELIEPTWPRLVRVWVDEVQRLRNRLGSIQDLAILRSMTGPHRPLAPWRSRLVPLIERQQGLHVKSAARIARRLFAEPPKAFQRRIEALWEAQT